MTEDIYTAKSFKFSWGHTQAPSSADGGGGAPGTACVGTGHGCTSGTRCAPVTAPRDQHLPWGARHGSTVVETALLLLGDRLSPPPQRDRAPCPCREDIGTTGAGPHLPNPKAPWAKPAPSRPGAQRCAVLGVGSDPTFAQRPEIMAQSSGTTGLGVVPGHAALPRLGRLWPLYPCPRVPVSPFPSTRGSRAGGAVPEHPRPRCLPPSAGSGQRLLPAAAPAAPGFAAAHRITESQHGRGWKGPLWVI